MIHEKARLRGKPVLFGYRPAVEMRDFLQQISIELHEVVAAKQVEVGIAHKLLEQAGGALRHSGGGDQPGDGFNLLGRITEIRQCGAGDLDAISFVVVVGDEETRVVIERGRLQQQVIFLFQARETAKTSGRG